MSAATANERPINVSGSREPWIAHGFTERTYYRRKAAGTLHIKPPPSQHAAHVDAYLKTLDWPARLDFRAYVRRCARPAPLPWTPAHLAPVTGAPA